MPAGWIMPNLLVISRQKITSTSCSEKLPWNSEITTRQVSRFRKFQVQKLNVNTYILKTIFRKLFPASLGYAKTIQEIWIYWHPSEKLASNALCQEIILFITTKFREWVTCQIKDSYMPRLQRRSELTATWLC